MTQDLLTTSAFQGYQRSIYEAGMEDAKPALPFNHQELEDKARALIGSRSYSWIGGGAGSGETMKANRAAFEKWEIVPRMLRDVTDRDLSAEVLGLQMDTPVMFAPIGVHKVMHPEAELATARAAVNMRMPLVSSTVSSFPMEDVAAQMGDSPRWYQLYWPTDHEFARSLIQRAEVAGYSALVVTLDTHYLAWRTGDLMEGNMPFWRGEGIANYTSDPIFRSRLEKAPEADMEAAINLWKACFSNPALTWDDLDFLRENTDLPILLKGITHPDDALEARRRGIDGIFVSNHGGRQVDGAIGALDALPSIVDAVGDELTILFDSGVRTGADMAKALALGADAVLLGRPFLYGLALGGQEGVAHVLRCLLAEFDLVTSLSGHTGAGELGRDSIEAS